MLLTPRSHCKPICTICSKQDVNLGPDKQKLNNKPVRVIKEGTVSARVYIEKVVIYQFSYSTNCLLYPLSIYLSYTSPKNPRNNAPPCKFKPSLLA